MLAAPSSRPARNHTVRRPERCARWTNHSPPKTTTLVIGSEYASRANIRKGIVSPVRIAPAAAHLGPTNVDAHA